MQKKKNQKNVYTTRNDPNPEMIQKIQIDLNTMRNDPRPQMIPKCFHTNHEGIPKELSEWNGWRFCLENKMKED